MTERQQRKARFTAMVNDAVALLAAAESPDSPEAQHTLRVHLETTHGASRMSAWRALRRALDLRDGRATPQWGGRRDYAPGRPRKTEGES